ncbi:pentapeptide repeat-containing protein [Pseudoalteromonas sp. S4389]|uniref:pentapeptide repeat-containing protein n=1 Tax=Pseudoalteromonas sp. S4389 TaxID=579556 RepID=UPI00201D46E2|nr:pentapeptide repeat-containing protein [Pseudoalteromonas sp. S4389]
MIVSHSLYFEHTFEVNLADQTFSHCEFEQCEFIDCDFNNSQFENCRFIGCEFKNCNLAALGLRYTSLEEGRCFLKV